MKKIYLKNNNGNMGPSKIIDVDGLSFMFNRTDGSVYATSSASAKTSNTILIKHHGWKKLEEIKRFNFEVSVMDLLAKAIDRLYKSDSFILEIDFDCSEVSTVYTFTIYDHAALATRFKETIEIKLFNEEE